jgi:Flp pilus assembly pilin Flp
VAGSKSGAGEGIEERKRGAPRMSNVFVTTRNEDGQALVEYALIIMLVALVTIAALTQIGMSVNNILNGLAGQF